MVFLIYNSTIDQRITSATVMCILYTTGMFCCSLVIFLTFYAKLHQTRVNLLLVNVTLADFIMLLECMILQPPNIISDEKGVGCTISGYLTYTAGLEANWFVPAVVVNRYISLYHQNTFKRVYTTRNILIMILCGWAVPIAFITPFLANGFTGFEYSYLNCGVNTQGAPTKWKVLEYIFIVSPTFIACSFTFYFNLRIFMKLREHANQTATLAKKNVMAQNRQLMYVTLLYTAWAVGLQGPYILGKLFPVIVEGNPLRQIFPWLYVSNGTINPLTTLYVVKPYRQAALKLLCRWKGDQVNPAVGGAIGGNQGANGTGTGKRISVRGRGNSTTTKSDLRTT